MSDLVDQAANATAHDLNVNMRRSHRAEPDIVANGYCHHCGYPVQAGRRWCDAACRDSWIDEGHLNGH